ncbi:MAG TPA: DUF2852 domain-containing protein [Stellaceae bacterium]|jgi:hypothetical protein|nr:DUF2852 domain-containing protein [Stellaceae bacterium]
MTIADRLDDIGKPAWIGLTIVSFMICWPLGVLVLGYLIGSGRMACCAQGGPRWQRRMERMQGRVDRMQAAAERWWGPRPDGNGGNGGGGGTGARSGPSGNHAFDEYRAETLCRLEEEQREFLQFLQRLRHAKDKAEFDQFMADRSRRPDDITPA